MKALMVRAVSHAGGRRDYERAADRWRLLGFGMDDD
jgi:hypothetical protein